VNEFSSHLPVDTCGQRNVEGYGELETPVAGRKQARGRLDCDRTDLELPATSDTAQGALKTGRVSNCE